MKATEELTEILNSIDDELAILSSNLFFALANDVIAYVEKHQNDFNGELDVKYKLLTLASCIEEIARAVETMIESKDKVRDSLTES